MFPIHLMFSNDEIEEALNKLSLMCQQEERSYKKIDYFCLEQPSRQFDVDHISRHQMMAWCDQVIDFCQLNHESVELAMNYLDRYVMTEQGREALRDRSLYQLACMTALYTTVKIHEATCMNPEMLCKLSHGLYTEQQFVAMEAKMLQAVQWKVNAPTTKAYIDLLLQLTPTDVPMEYHDLIRQYASQQAECLLRVSTLIATKASVIAYCSLISVLHSLNFINPTTATLLASSVGIYAATDEIMLIQKHLSESSVAVHSPQHYEVSEIHPNTSLCAMNNASVSNYGTSPQYVAMT